MNPLKKFNPSGLELFAIRIVMIKYILYNFLFLFFCLIVFNGCKKKISPFGQLNSLTTGIDFINHVNDTDTLNVFDYLYYYNGAGVATGDINNDGLADIYFVANQGGNKLYLNKGDFKFEDITAKAGVKGNADWSTGVTMADVNGDGWLDIYVCAVANHRPKSTGPASTKVYFQHSKNQLFINNHDGTFVESAASYGLDAAGYSTQAAFFDFDKDGDLDMFLIQHSIHQTSSYGDTSLRSEYSDVSGCKLFRNDGNHFTNITKESGLYSSALGYGLGIAVADFNNDGWDDVYVGNDFHENDYYFINNKQGGFRDQNLTAFGHESLFSMGNDAVDFNNDGHTDLITLDMLPDEEREIKRSMSDESHDEYEDLYGRMGYQYQYSRNCLQVNMNNGQRFAETGLYSGIAATDWSWSVLGADFNLDGNKDIFIANGIKRRLNDLDFIRFQSSEAIEIGQSKDYRSHDAKLFDHMRDAAKKNYLFLNNGDLRFTNVAEEYGFDKPTLSNGASYADLDNDGDLDLVVNNINEQAGIFKNEVRELANKNYLSVKFIGAAANKFGIGTKVYAFAKNKLQYQELQTTRGFMSSVEPLLSFGFDSASVIDSVIVLWPGNKVQRMYNVKSNQRLLVNFSNAKDSIADQALFIDQLINKKAAPSLIDITSAINLNWKHNENLSFSDFNRNPFIPHLLSTLGPALAVADVNNDGLDDIFLGGARGQPAALFVQNVQGKFNWIPQPAISNDSLCEDVKAVFFDADNDGDKDLYVASGGGEFYGNVSALADRLYLNNGKGDFIKSTSLPPLYENKGAVAIADYDKDGDMDIFVGGRASALNYGGDTRSYLLNNNKGAFTIINQTVVGLNETGMVSSAAWQDLNNDGYPELITVGEWNAPVIYQNTKGKLAKINNQLINNLTGLWQSVFVTDVNNDGLPDILLGNYGLNTKLTASEKYPLKLYCKDFDNNHNIDQVLAIAKDGKYYTFLGKETLEKQLPYINKQFLSYEKLAGKTVEEIFGNKLEGAVILNANTLASIVLINKGNFNFDTVQMPQEFQWMPLFAFAQLKQQSIIGGGNFYGILPFEGRYDNALLPIMKFDKKTLSQTSLMFAEGEVREMQWMNMAGKKKALVIVRNNMEPKIFVEP
ncbi:MAG: VCBS repeat-containing protein [Ferruginibacter sp.]